MRPTLNTLDLKYGTGKASNVHNYLRYVETYLEPRRDWPMTMLEIGIAEGRSLNMWREYFPNGRIAGIDIRTPTLQIEECEFFQGS